MKKGLLTLIIVGLLAVIMAQVFLAGLRYEKLDYRRVIDGDTFVVVNLRDGQEWRVRLMGVNAPDEKKCYYKEATEILRRELTGKKIVYERFGYDGFGRILAKVYVDGISLEEKLVATGAAFVYDAVDVHDNVKPSKEYINSLKVIEFEAKNKKLGIWSSVCDRI